MRGFLTDEILTRVQDLRPIADDLGLTMAQLAIAWVLQNPNVAAAIIGATRPEQVHDNVKAAGVRLDDDVLRRIDEVLGDVVERDPAKSARGWRRPPAAPVPPQPRRRLPPPPAGPVSTRVRTAGSGVPCPPLLRWPPAPSGRRPPGCRRTASRWRRHERAAPASSLPATTRRRPGCPTAGRRPLATPARWPLRPGPPGATSSSWLARLTPVVAGV